MPLDDVGCPDVAAESRYGVGCPAGDDAHDGLVRYRPRPPVFRSHPLNANARGIEIVRVTFLGHHGVVNHGCLCLETLAPHAWVLLCLHRTGKSQQTEKNR